MRPAPATGLALPWLRSDLHPEALSITEAALSNGQLDDRALAHDVDALSPPPIIRRLRAVLPDGVGTNALSAAGFSPVRVTGDWVLPLSVIAHPALAAGPPRGLAPHWFSPSERGPWRPWCDAHWRHYERTHRLNPPRRPAAPDLDAIFTGADLVEAFAYRGGPRGRIAAFTSLRSGEELGWTATADPRDDALLAATLSAGLRRATARGWSRLVIEADDDDAGLWALLERIVPCGPRRRWITWHRERQGARPLS